VSAVASAAGKPTGKPTPLPYERPDPFADFDGDGVPELATWHTSDVSSQRATYTITVWFDRGAKPVRWDHTVTTAPSELSFVTAGGHPAAMFSPTGLGGDWIAPSDLEVFALTRAGGKPMPDAPRDLWQVGEPDRRLRWGQSACVDQPDADPSLVGYPAAWWERHLVAARNDERPGWPRPHTYNVRRQHVGWLKRGVATASGGTRPGLPSRSW
jgi:hypothetical protein